MVTALWLLCLLVYPIYALLTFALGVGWRTLPEKPASAASNSAKPPVSVIIPFRNEAASLTELLHDLAAQSYRPFDVILVDDHSTDGSAQIALEAAAALQLETTLVTLADTHLGFGKKAAVTAAIQHAETAYFLTTDADCRLPPNWLAQMVGPLVAGDAHLVSGPVSFSSSGTVFQQLQVVEFLSLIGAGAVSLHWKKPTMCNGANLAYTREAFESVGGFDGSWHIASGDDEFLMHKIHQQYPGGTIFLKSSEALVITEATASWAAFVQQRKRWGSKWLHYQAPSAKITAVAVFLFHLAFLLSFAFFLSGQVPLLWILFFIGLKTAAEYYYLSGLLSFTAMKALRILIFPLVFLHPFYIVFMAISATLSGYRWKGRNKNDFGKI